MTAYIRIKAAEGKDIDLLRACQDIRAARPNSSIFHVDPQAFTEIPGSPFAYWSSESLRANFRTCPSFEHGSRCARVGLQTSDDFRFVRTWWESASYSRNGKWFPLVRGGSASKFFGNLKLQVNWEKNGAELKAWASKVNHGQHWSRNIRSPDFYMRPGITWPLRTAEMSPYPMPAGCIFSTRGTVAFEEPSKLGDLLGLMSSEAFDYLFKLLLGRFGHPEFSIGAIQRVPVPEAMNSDLGRLAIRGWLLKYTLDTVEETSHAFLLPAMLRPRLSLFDPPAIAGELQSIQTEINEIAFELYRFSAEDRAAITLQAGASDGESQQSESEDEVEDAEAEVPADEQLALRSWTVGVGFGRFDWRLATGERESPPEPDPFDPLPAKSPGMLPDGAEPFHVHPGILVDDPGHPHDLVHLVEEVLARVDVAAPNNVRRWLQRDFFPFHLQRYSKSRRKAPIYWPLATASGSYTLWVYYPSLGSQTLYTAVNDFVEPRLKQMDGDLAALRNKGSDRTRDDEQRFESLQTSELELIELRDILLKLAPTYKPNHDDGVQIGAAPLWPLFRHKPWQKVLKDTWAKLERGDYDWAHLAMSYWSDRVREKCKTDKSLAIAHGLEDLYVEPEAKPKKARGRK